MPLGTDATRGSSLQRAVIHHQSIAANEPEHVAEVLAELMGGVAGLMLILSLSSRRFSERLVILLRVGREI